MSMIMTQAPGENGTSSRAWSGQVERRQSSEDPDNVAQVVPADSVFGVIAKQLVQRLNIVDERSESVNRRVLRGVEGGGKRKVPVVVSSQIDVWTELALDPVEEQCDTGSKARD